MHTPALDSVKRIVDSVSQPEITGFVVRRAVFLAGLLLAACAPAPSEREDAVSDAPLVAVVETRSLEADSAVEAAGTAAWRREPVLAFAAPGVIASIAVDEGDVVRRGQRLASLRRTTSGSNPDETALAARVAEQELQRARRLYEQELISKARLDQAELAAVRARDAAALTAPADGVILRRFAEPAQTVGAGTPVLLLGETASGLVVRVAVPSSEAVRIRTGASVRVEAPGGASHPGAVSRIGAAADGATGSVEVEVELQDAAALRSGMVVKAVIAAQPTGAAAWIVVPPLSLLDARADQGIVLVVDEKGVARRRAVRTAGLVSEGVVVLDGLRPGERVVSEGAAYVRDGEAVRTAPAR